jgi:hypothetical protein
MQLKEIAFENVDWICLAQGTADCHEYGNRLLVFMKGGEFLDQFSDYQLFKIVIPCSLLLI